MIKDFRFINIEVRKNRTRLFSLFFALFSLFSFSQVKTSVDSTSIKIGQEITYKIEVETDTVNVVVFPEGQTFMPLEVIESYKIDTTKRNAKYNLIKKYGLTQFDSGRYAIPKQKVIVGTKEFLTDSLTIEVNNVLVDTTKQGLYGIKPIIEVNKSGGSWWKYLLLTLLVFTIIGFLLWWFIWRKKPLTEEEEIALLPPYDRAKLALKKLDESGYLQKEELKEYYSDLTFIIRKYLDEKVYDHALESTTEELISRLMLLKDGNQIDLKEDDILKIKNILQRADLVKFAKSAPDIELAKMDRQTIDLELDLVKEALPEPTEEEKLLIKEYEQEEKRKRRLEKIVLTSVIGFLLLLMIGGGIIAKHGFTNVKDTITGKQTKKLLEGEWVQSAYGFPKVNIETPEVLERQEVSLPDEIKDKASASSFHYKHDNELEIVLSTMVYKQEKKQEAEANNGDEQVAMIASKLIDKTLKQFEAKGYRNIISNNEKFVTPNGAEGLKVSGSYEYALKEGSDKYVPGKFTLLVFTASEDVIVTHAISMAYLGNEDYLKKIHDRVLNSIELKEQKTEE